MPGSKLGGQEEDLGSPIALGSRGSALKTCMTLKVPPTHGWGPAQVLWGLSGVSGTTVLISAATEILYTENKNLEKHDWLFPQNQKQKLALTC